MNISKFFIDRPIFAGVLSVLILLAGLLSVFQLPISEYRGCSTICGGTRPISGCKPKSDC